ncbi:MAG: serine hydrolase domain-containing protein [Pseudomonadota bacterium]
MMQSLSIYTPTAVLALAGLLLTGATLSHLAVAEERKWPEAEWRVPDPESRLPIDVNRLEAFIDGAAHKLSVDPEIPGMAIAVVRSDAPLVVKGYGWSNGALDLPVDPQKHPFHIGSVSKVIAAAAVMKLVGRGKIDMNASVGDYLPAEVFEDSLGAYTVADLLGHTTGMEEIYANFIGTVPDADKLSDSEILARYRPAQIRPPGQTSYTNHTWVLLGQVVEAVTGVRFEQYVERNILAPTGMYHSGFEPETDEELAVFERVRGQVWENGRYRTMDLAPQPLHRLLFPTGGLRSSAADMGRFMRMYLNMGSLDGVQILAEETVRQSGRHLTQQAPETNGRTDTFWTYRIGAHTVYDHTGRVAGFISRLIIVPSLDIGVFININNDVSAGAGSLVRYLPAQIIRYVLGNDVEQLAPRSTETFDPARYTGRYMLSRRNDTSIEKLMLTRFASVSETGEGELLLNGSKLFYPVAEDLFQSSRTGEYLRFYGVENGRAEYFSVGGSYISFAQRVSFFQSREFLVLLVAPGFIVAGLQLLVFLMRALGLQVVNRQRESLFDQSSTAAWLLRACSVTFVAACIVLWQAGSPIVATTEAIYDVFPSPYLGFGFLLLHFAVFLSFLAGLAVITEWFKGNGTLAQRGLRSAMGVAYLTLSFGLIYWNLVPDSLMA